MAPDEFDDNPLEPAEQLDSDQVRNDDGDEVVDPPQEWIEAEDHETLDERLAEETPDVSPRDWGHSPRKRWAHPLAGDDLRDADDADDEPIVLTPDDELDRIDPQRHGHKRGQIDGTPEDGDSFFDVVK